MSKLLINNKIKVLQNKEIASLYLGQDSLGEELL